MGDEEQKEEADSGGSLKRDMKMIKQGIAKVLLGLGIILCATAIKLDGTLAFQFMKEEEE